MNKATEFKNKHNFVYWSNTQVQYFADEQVKKALEEVEKSMYHMDNTNDDFSDGWDSAMITTQAVIDKLKTKKQ